MSNENLEKAATLTTSMSPLSATASGPQGVHLPQLLVVQEYT
jgi:hypothetical protein